MVAEAAFCSRLGHDYPSEEGEAALNSTPQSHPVVFPPNSITSSTTHTRFLSSLSYLLPLLRLRLLRLQPML
jgi:hypothetical protein